MSNPDELVAVLLTRKDGHELLRLIGQYKPLDEMTEAFAAIRAALARPEKEVGRAWYCEGGHGKWNTIRFHRRSDWPKECEMCRPALVVPVEWREP